MLDKAVEFCKNHSDEVVVYGAGNDLNMLETLYPEFQIRYLCDRSVEKQQNGWHGIPVLSPEKLFRQKDRFYIAVNTYMYHKEIV